MCSTFVLIALTGSWKGFDTRFPGAQPVSFNKQSLDVMLKKEYVFCLINVSFWVCEKSDGLRVLLLIVVPPATNIQEVYLVCVSLLISD